MISVYKNINEGFVRTAVSGALGLAGTPLGALVNLYNQQKNEEEKAKIAKKLGKKVEVMASSKIIKSALLSSIPVIGAVENILTAHKLSKSQKALKELQKKADELKK